METLIQAEYFKQDKMKVNSVTTFNPNTPDQEFILLKTESILMLNKSDSLKVNVDTEVPNDLNTGTVSWEFQINFIDDNTRGANYNEVKFPEDNENGAIINLYNWYHKDWVENIEPYYFESKDKQNKIYIKIRTSSIESMNLRSVILTIWKSK